MCQAMFTVKAGSNPVLTSKLIEIVKKNNMTTVLVVFLLVTSIIFNCVFFNIITQNQKLILDEIEELKNKSYEG